MVHLTNLATLILLGCMLVVMAYIASQVANNASSIDAIAMRGSNVEVNVPFVAFADGPGGRPVITVLKPTQSEHDAALLKSIVSVLNAQTNAAMADEGDYFDTESSFEAGDEVGIVSGDDSDDTDPSHTDDVTDTLVQDAAVDNADAMTACEFFCAT